MGTSYNRIAGQSVERLAAQSDGVFAVAMTFMTLGIFWVGQQTQLNHAGVDVGRRTGVLPHGVVILLACCPYAPPFSPLF